MMNRKVPVILIMFNRPDVSGRVFEAIRAEAPEKLFLAVDGPRPDRLGEGDLCRACRALEDKVDWDCEVHTRFSEVNQGCREGVRNAISWFFEHVEEGIILEDDCLPNSSFFQFASDMLERYSENDSIGAIAGNNFQRDESRSRSSYYYSNYFHIWGWATWRRAWDCFDDSMRGFDSDSFEEVLRGKVQQSEAFDFWYENLKNSFNRVVDTWDFAWLFSCWLNDLVCVVPGQNLVTNIGFGEKATHTMKEDAPLARLPVREMVFPVNGPDSLKVASDADLYTEMYAYGINRRKLREASRRGRRRFADSQ